MYTHDISRSIARGASCIVGAIAIAVAVVQFLSAAASIIPCTLLLAFGFLGFGRLTVGPKMSRRNSIKERSTPPVHMLVRYRVLLSYRPGFLLVRSELLAEELLAVHRHNLLLSQVLAAVLGCLHAGGCSASLLCIHSDRLRSWRQRTGSDHTSALTYKTEKKL